MNTIEERFWSHVQKTDTCWLWTAHTTNGYGQFCQSHGKTVYAHRFVWELYYGTIPNKMCICHICDNPSCVNPSHLFCGSYSDNTNDMIAKGRDKLPHGINHFLGKRDCCKHGHLFPPNSWNGHYRVCRICNVLRTQKWQKAHPEANKHNNDIQNTKRVRRELKAEAT